MTVAEMYCDDVTKVAMLTGWLPVRIPRNDIDDTAYGLIKVTAMTIGYRNNGNYFEGQLVVT